MIKRLAIAIMCATLLACVSSPIDPNAPQMTDEQKQEMQIRQVISSTRTALLVADLYVSTKDDEWNEEKIEKYKTIIAQVRTAIDLAEALLSEGDITSAESQQLIIVALMEALEEQADKD